MPSRTSGAWLSFSLGIISYRIVDQGRRHSRCVMGDYVSYFVTQNRSNAVFVFAHGQNTGEYKDLAANHS